MAGLYTAPGRTTITSEVIAADGGAPQDGADVRRTIMSPSVTAQHVDALVAEEVR